MLRACFIRRGGQNQFSREQVIVQLNPDLPIEARLPEGVMFASNTFHDARSKVVRGRDFIGAGTLSTPKEEIQ